MYKNSHKRSLERRMQSQAQAETAENSLTSGKRPSAGYAGRRTTNLRFLIIAAIAVLAIALAQVAMTKPASAQVAPVQNEGTGSTVTGTASQANGGEPGGTPGATGGSGGPAGPQGPAGPTGPTGGDNATASASLNVDLGGALTKPSNSIMIIILITLLSTAPALLIMMTSFTRVIIVLTLTRNALGVVSIPPNQVLVGLALFISLFIMSPTLSEMNKTAIQPYMKGEINQTQAYTEATKPLKAFMLKQTRQEELALFVNASGAKPDVPENVSMQALVPAFILSEMKTAFIIGFVIFIPFLVIDIIVSSSLMSMGMAMLPPQMISLPFKLLLFVMVDGWALVVKSLLTSFN